MQTTAIRLALLASVSLLAACGGKNDAEDSDAAATGTNNPDVVVEAPSDSPVAIPDAPVDPLVEVNAKKSAEFIAAEKARDGVEELESGLLFEVLEEGEGGATPTESDLLLFHYKGMTADGRQFDDSTTLGHPLILESYSQVPIPGIPDALARMHEGEKARVIVPPEQGFGEEGLPGLFAPNETLIFELDLIEIVTEAETERRAEVMAERDRLEAEARLDAAASEAETELAQLDRIMPSMPHAAVETDAVKAAAAELEKMIASYRTAATSLVDAAKQESLEGVDVASLINTRDEQREAINDGITSYVEAVGAANTEASATFLAEMREKNGVTATDSGLLYEVVEDNGSGATPAPTDTVRVHYKGTLPDGTKFDSSYDRGEPTEFPLNGVIAGWTEGVALMNVGDKYRFYIPANLAYRERGTPGGIIGPNQALVFDVELIDIVGQDAE